MKFVIKSTTWSEINELIERYGPRLVRFGLTVDVLAEPKYVTIRDEYENPLQFEYDGKTVYKPCIFLDCVEQLMELSKAVQYPLIVDAVEGTIEIYDGCRE